MWCKKYSKEVSDKYCKMCDADVKLPAGSYQHCPLRVKE